MPRPLTEEMRVLIPEGSMLAKTAFIYNGLEDMDLKYAGRQFHIPYKEITKIDVFQWREVDEMNGARILYSLEGEAVAKELVEKHDWDEAGLAVFIEKQTMTDKDGVEHVVGLDKAEIEALKERCDRLGRQYKLNKIETFRKEREMGRAGIHGHRIHPTEKEIRWMKELDISDELFNPSNAAADSEQKMKEIVAAATKPFADMLERLIAAQEKPEPKGGHSGPTGPRRRSVNGKLESIESWNKRVEEWKAAMAAVEKAEAEAPENVEA
jgi:hypothetical protein